MIDKIIFIIWALLASFLAMFFFIKYSQIKKEGEIIDEILDRINKDTSISRNNVIDKNKKLLEEFRRRYGT